MKEIAAIGLAVALILISLAGVNCGSGADDGDTRPPEISDISVSCVGGSRSTVIISWTTNEPATGNIEYGLDTNYGAVCPTPADTIPNNTNHSYTIINLSPDRDYHFRLISTDDVGNEAITRDYIFPTSGTYSIGAKWIAHNTPSIMEAGQSYPVTVIVNNKGALPWPSSGSEWVCLSYHWNKPSGELVVWDDISRSILGADVAPLISTTFNATVTAPRSPGSYILHWDLLYSPFTWFSSAGCPTLDVPVQVTM